RPRLPGGDPRGAGRADQAQDLVPPGGVPVLGRDIHRPVFWGHPGVMNPRPWRASGKMKRQPSERSAMQPEAQPAVQPAAAVYVPGTRIMLRSGGPGMVVADIGAHTGFVWCRWMSSDGEAREAAFPPGMLRTDPRDVTPGCLVAHPQP